MTNPDREEWQILDLFGNWVPAPSKAAAIGCVQDGTATALRLASSDGAVKGERKKSKVHTLQIKVRFDRPCSVTTAVRDAGNCLKEGEFYPSPYRDGEPETMTILSITRKPGRIRP